MKCLSCDDEALPRKALCSKCLEFAENRRSHQNGNCTDTPAAQTRFKRILSVAVAKGYLKVGSILLLFIIVLSHYGVRFFPYLDKGKILAPDEPIQEMLSPIKTWSEDGINYTARARYDIKARIITNRKYFLGVDSDTRQFDFCVGWGRMSDSEILSQMSFRQVGRFCSYLYGGDLVNYLKTHAISQQELANHFANMHLIPANWKIALKLRMYGKDDLIHLRGYLVDVSGPNWSVMTSLTREDSGDGACETMWVEEVGSN